MTTTKIRSSTQLFIDADLAMGGFKITGLNTAAPTADGDAANKKYVDDKLIAMNSMTYMGVVDASANPNWPAANSGDTYRISVAGKMGGASGKSVTIGDLIICSVDGSVSGTDVAVGANWDIVHVNASAGTVSSTATSPLDNQLVRLDGNSATTVQNSLATIDDSGSINLPTGQTLKVNSVDAVNHNVAGDVQQASVGGALTIQASVVTLAKMANVATGTVFYRKTAATGAPEVQTLATLKSDLGLTGTNSGDQTITLSGDVSGSGTTAITTAIGAGKVTLAMQANLAANSIMGNNTGAPATPLALTVAQVKTLLAYTLASADFANQGTTTTVLHGNGAGNPAFGAVVTNDITDANITYAKIQNVSATNTLLGRKTVGAGVVEEISPTGDLGLVGSTFTITAGAVTLAKMANMATGSLFYRKTAGSGAPEVQTLATLKTDLAYTAADVGAVPTTRTVNGKALSSDITLALASADFANQGSTTTVLHGNGAGNPSFGAIVTGDITAKAITLALMADVATGTVFYRKTAATGVPEVQTLATLKADLGLTGTNGGDQTITLSGDVSGSGTGAITTAIGAGKVTLAMLANLSGPGVVMGRKTAGAGVPEEIAFVTREVPTGTKNGANATFSLAHTPITGTEELFLNGILLNQGAGNDYTISTATITMLTGMIPVATDVILANYRY